MYETFICINHRDWMRNPYLAVIKKNGSVEKTKTFKTSAAARRWMRWNGFGRWDEFLDPLVY